MNAKQLIEELSKIPDDVQINIVVGTDDDDTFSGWNPKVFSYESGDDAVVIYSSLEDNAHCDDVNASQDTLIAAEVARLDAAIYNRGAE